MLFGLGIAMLLGNLKNRFSRIMRVALIFPADGCPVVGTIIWQLMLRGSVGIIDKLLNLIGILGHRGASHQTALLTVVMIDVWINCPFVIILILRDPVFA